VPAETYGPLKVMCERVAAERWGDTGLTIVRPTYVVGPRDMTARYPWWVLRATRGGRMILPGPDDAPMQCVDARDMGAWTVRLAEDRVAGVFNGARPHTTFGDLVRETTAAVGGDVELVPVDGTFLGEQGVDGGQLPLWSEGEPDNVLAMSVARAEATGLIHRPFEDVVRDTLAWAQANPEQATRDGVGLSAEREQELIDAAGPTS
jgi:2'-hydroxyisoflavone reductase